MNESKTRIIYNGMVFVPMFAYDQRAKLDIKYDESFEIIEFKEKLESKPYVCECGWDSSNHCPICGTCICCDCSGMRDPKTGGLLYQ